MSYEQFLWRFQFLSAGAPSQRAGAAPSIQQCCAVATAANSSSPSLLGISKGRTEGLDPPLPARGRNACFALLPPSPQPYPIAETTNPFPPTVWEGGFWVFFLPRTLHSGGRGFVVVHEKGPSYLSPLCSFLKCNFFHLYETPSLPSLGWHTQRTHLIAAGRRKGTREKGRPNYTAREALHYWQARRQLPLLSPFAARDV